MLTDFCCSVKWEVYLYGDVTFKVDCVCVEGLPSSNEEICVDNYFFQVHVDGLLSQCEVGGVSVR